MQIGLLLTGFVKPHIFRLVGRLNMFYTSLRKLKGNKRRGMDCGASLFIRHMIMKPINNEVKEREH